MMLQPILSMIVIMVVGVGSLIAFRWLWRRFHARHRSSSNLQRCTCGYILVGLEIPRCPECGRMIGFDKTPAELGLSEEQMRAHALQKKTTPRT